MTEDYAFVVKCLADALGSWPIDDLISWPYEHNMVIIGVHKFVNMSAATNALMHALGTFAQDTLGIKLEDVILNDPCFVMAPAPGGFVINRHIPGVDGWIMRGISTNIPIVSGRVVRALNVRPDNCVETTNSLEKSLIIAETAKVSLENDLREVREQLRELKDAFKNIINNTHQIELPSIPVVARTDNAPQPPVPQPPAKIPPPVPPIIAAEALVAELAAFNRSSLLSRSQRDRKLREKSAAQADKYTVVYGDCHDYGDDRGNGEDIYGIEYDVDDTRDEAEPRWDEEEWATDFPESAEIDWIDDNVSCRSRKSSPISTPAVSQSSSPAENLFGELALKRTNTFPNGLMTRSPVLFHPSTPKNTNLPYPLSAPGYLANVVFSDSAVIGSHPDRLFRLE